MEIIPPELLEKEYSELYHALCELEENESGDIRNWDEICEDIWRLAKYGHDHFDGEVSHEGYEVNFFTQILIAATPERLKKGSKRRKDGELTEEMIRRINDINNYPEFRKKLKEAQAS